MPNPTVTDVAPVLGAGVVPGDRILTENGWSPIITHFVEAPPGSFAASMFGEGTRVPFHWAQPIARPLAAEAPVAVQAREAA